MSLKKSDKIELRRTEILEQFQLVLKDEGFEGASMAKIAKRMGVNPSLLVHYFSTKEEMIAELVKFTLEKYEVLILEKTKEAATPEARLNSILDLLFGFDWISQIDSSAYYSCYYLSFRNETVHKRMAAMYSRFKTELSHLLSQCMDQKIIYRDDPDMLADFIICNIEGATFYRNIAADADHYTKICSFLKEKLRQILFRDIDAGSEPVARKIKEIKKESLCLAEALIQKTKEIKQTLGGL